MNCKRIFILAALVGTLFAACETVEAGNRRRINGSRWNTWHAGYYNAQWQRPVAVVVPPTATLQTNYGWGVNSTRVEVIPYQFQRAWPGYQAGGGYPGLRPMPVWPSDTTQFGYYYVRGPW